ncbi:MULTISPECIES: putative bifunctional diguanylate cyclase/phosphodiesterase [unclassified Thiocapsa]|uniref:putative bifunctional diguanylate cyclase/phosphodiesterase n=1 Tax=unclassified Thiocapsa TaxID=2641286 RepID=UPI0035B4A849
MSNQPPDGTAEGAFKDLFGELCDDSIALAAGVFDNAGNGIYLNRGMRLMLEGIAAGTSCGNAFVNPSFAALRELTLAGAAFSGVLTLGDGRRVHRSLAARVWRRDDRLLVAGEMDVLELDRLNQVLIAANREINALQRELMKQNRLLRESEARLSESEERLKLAVDAAGIGVWDYAVASRCLLWDTGMSRLHGRVAEPMTTDPATWAELLHPEDRSTFEHALAHAVQGLGPLLCDLRVYWPDGDERHLRAHGRLFRGDEEASARVIGICYDVTDQMRADARIQALAFHDPLTRLANRRLLMERIGQAQARSHRRGDHGALILLDIDHFKRLNDSLGHDLGDALLIQVAERLSVALRETDTAARLGGDELVVLCEALDVKPESAAHEAAMIGEKIGALIREPYRLHPGDHAHSCTASIGITLFHGHETSGSELLKQADIAMYQAKRAGRETLRLFQPAMQQAIEETARRERALRQAVAQDDLQLVYQPQVDRDGRWVGCEALLRWSLRDGTTLSPADFLVEVETTDLMPVIGDWVVRTACRDIASLPGRAPTGKDLVLGINLSARQFADPRLIERVLAIIHPLRFPPARLRFEISEASLFGDFERNAAILERLGAAGIEIELDDFGSGYSSLVHLRQLPLSGVKIDQLLIAALDTDPYAAMIVRAAIGIADALALPIIAEGVERETQRDLLLDMGCSRFQGFLFGRPMPFDAFCRAFERECA